MPRIFRQKYYRFKYAICTKSLLSVECVKYPYQKINEGSLDRHQASVLFRRIKKHYETNYLLVALASAASCNSRSDSSDNGKSTLNTEENVDENSGENISPQLEHSANRFKVDSMSSASEADQQKKKDLKEVEPNQ